ncbi:MAG: LCP family protein [Parcubacteria group bacterium]|nr:LCP family protein [Parcubacteria group bacterium]
MEFQYQQLDFNQETTHNRKQKKIIKWGIILFFAFLIIFFGFRFGIAYHQITVKNESTWKQIAHVFSFIDQSGQKKENPDYILPPKEDSRIDILVLGIRGEQDKENGGLLADSIMILSIDTKSEKTAMVSIPRDLLIKIPGIQKQEKINTIYPIDLERGSNLALTKEMLSRISGVYIDHEIVINMGAFAELVETLGGITITLQKPFEENQQWGYPFKLEAGTQNLNGEQALYYVRSRFSSSDFDRARRQQEVILAIKNKLLNLGILANPLKINDLIGIVQKNVRTDIGAWELQSLIRTAIGLKDVKSRRFVISTENLLFETHLDGVYVLLPLGNDFSKIKELFQNILKDPFITPTPDISP